MQQPSRDALALAQELDALGSETPPGSRVAAAFRAYTKCTGEPVDDVPSDEQRAHVRTWLRDLLFEDPTPIGWTRRSVLQPTIHADMAEKAQWLQQAPCVQCRLIPAAGVPPLPTWFTIPVRPFTKQVAPTKQIIHKAITDAIMRTPRDPEQWRGVAICATVVSVQATAQKIIDVDNAAKAILDTMGGTIFPNDRQIQHLSVSRLQAAGTEGYYLIGLRPAYPHGDDVVAGTAEVMFLGTIRPIRFD